MHAAFFASDFGQPDYTLISGHYHWMVLLCSICTHAATRVIADTCMCTYGHDVLNWHWWYLCLRVWTHPTHFSLSAPLVSKWTDTSMSSSKACEARRTCKTLCWIVRVYVLVAMEFASVWSLVCRRMGQHKEANTKGHNFNTWAVTSTNIDIQYERIDTPKEWGELDIMFWYERTNAATKPTHTHVPTIKW